MSRFVCECCRKEFSVALREVHHASPREFGTPEGMDDVDDPRNLVELDEHCHSLIHKVALLLHKGKDPRELLRSVHEHHADCEAIVQRTLELAGIIVRAMNSGRSDAHREYAKPVVDLDYDFYNLEVKAAAKASGCSVARFMADAVMRRTIEVNGHSAMVLQHNLTDKHEPARRRQTRRR